MGGRGSFSSAIILAMSSLETCLVLSRMTEEGRVVTRSGVLGLTSRLGKGVVGAGVKGVEGVEGVRHAMRVPALHRPPQRRVLAAAG